MELFGCSCALFIKEKEESHGGDKEIKTTAGGMAQRLAALASASSQPSVTLQFQGIQCLLLASAGTHTHTRTAHKLMWGREHATYTLQKNNLKKINIVLLNKGPVDRAVSF